MRGSWRRPGIFPVLFTLCALVACGAEQEDVASSGEPAESAVARIEGEVFYRERMLLPPGAEVEVQLQDISRADDKPVDIRFLAQDKRAGGFSGCNRYTGSYSLDGVSEHGSALTFGPMAGTMMACEQGSELEQAYLQVLGKVTAYRLQGETLSLLTGPEVVATYKPM